jgi:transcriptional regulator with XRE-family HTH domain
MSGHANTTPVSHQETMSDQKTLGEIVREARLAKEMSLRALAKLLCITPSYMSDIENDRRIPSEEVLRGIVELLDLDFDYLMALAGRFGENADRYMKKQPVAGVLFRRLSESNLQEDALRELLRRAEELGKKRDPKA